MSTGEASIFLHSSTLESTDSPVMEDSSEAVVAQLPVENTETHSFPPQPCVRSQSMPIASENSNQSLHMGSTLVGTNLNETRATAAAKIEHFKNWSISTYKCTRQLISEKLGKSTRTQDTEIELQIESLKDVQRKYLNILRLSRALSSHFQHVVVTQKGLGEAFSDLAQKSPELQGEFLCNSETQRSLSRHGEVLLAALNFFVSSVNTLVNKTMEDTLLTIKRYEAARIEYDAYRSDLEALQATAVNGESGSPTTLTEAQRSHDTQKVEFEKLRADVSVKLRFLNENRVKVMHKQLLLFHNAVSAYFTGNQTALEATLKQFNIKMKSVNVVSPSWLEQ